MLQPDGAVTKSGGDIDAFLKALAAGPARSGGRAWDDHLGRTIAGRYRLGAFLGAGSMGAVFGARDAEGAEVAIKLLRPELATDQRYLERFEREAEAAARLHHPSVVRVLDHGVSDNVPFLVMERLTGTTLAQRILEGPPLARREVADVVEGAGRALAHAHERGIVHRDVKPANVHLGGDGAVTLLDFGIAVLTDEDRARLTESGVTLGTPAYMAPEQLGPGPVGPACDQYALAVIAFELLGGELPYEARSRSELVIAKVTAPPRSLATLRPELGHDVADVLAPALSKSSEDRFPAVDAFAATLRRALTG